MFEYPYFSAAFFGKGCSHAYSHDTDGIFRSAVFYYLNPEPSLILTDSLDVENTAEERISTFTSLVQRPPANQSDGPRGQLRHGVSQR